MSDDGYILRARDRDEIARLRFQHEVWKGETDEVIRRAGFGEEDRLLDLGCGPGFLSLDLAERVGPGGRVVGVDASELFVEHLRREVEARDRGWIEARHGDVRELGEELPTGFDGVVCRWLLMFLPDPERVIGEAARLLRPGGVFVGMEYFQFRSMSLRPRGELFAKIFRAVHEQIARAGGDAGVGSRLPRLLTEAGFEIVDLVPILRVGRPGTPLWSWLEGTDTHHPQLVEADLVTEDELAAYREEWRAASATPDAFFTAPPVLATIARLRA